MKYNVYFIFPSVKIQNFISTLHRSNLLKCTSELLMPITFSFGNESIKCGSAFSLYEHEEYFGTKLIWALLTFFVFHFSTSLFSAIVLPILRNVINIL